MGDTVPPLDAATLRSLRAILREVGPGARAGIPLAEVVSLPAYLPGGLGLTVDFAAARDLGQPLVVLRVPVPATPGPSPCLAPLSARERAIAGMIAAGLANKQIATRESIALATVKAHVHSILRKTGLPNRAAVAAAVAGID